MTQTFETSEITLAMGRVYVLAEAGRVLGTVVTREEAREWQGSNPNRHWYECSVSTDPTIPELGSGDEPDEY